jgi:hypothetical protein
MTTIEIIIWSMVILELMFIVIIPLYLYEWVKLPGRYWHGFAVIFKKDRSFMTVDFDPLKTETITVKGLEGQPDQQYKVDKSRYYRMKYYIPQLVDLKTVRARWKYKIKNARRLRTGVLFFRENDPEPKTVPLVILESKSQVDYMDAYDIKVWSTQEKFKKAMKSLISRAISGKLSLMLIVVMVVLVVIIALYFFGVVKF